VSVMSAESSAAKLVIDRHSACQAVLIGSEIRPGSLARDIPMRQGSPGRNAYSMTGNNQERETAPHDPGSVKTIYAPASERVSKPPLPGDDKLINQHRE
jgi:hypothetical protein